VHIAIRCNTIAVARQQGCFFPRYASRYLSCALSVLTSDANDLRCRAFRAVRNMLLSKYLLRMLIV